MNWTQVSQLTLVWWNTSLSPPIPKPDTKQSDRDYVAREISEMRTQLDVSVFGLAEVCGSDLEVIMHTVGDRDLRLVDTTDRSGRSKIDTALIYDRSKLELVETVATRDIFGVTTLKTCQRATFMTLLGHYIHVFFSHWPCRLHIGEHDPIRPELGASLRNAVNRHGAMGNYHILMGDYNDDPCSPSLANHLLATRDRNMAQENRTFLYNPFWRKLGETVDHDERLAPHSVCGTHFYRAGRYTQWHTFDQLMFSSEFLQDGPMVLDEQHTRIIVTESLKTRILDRTEKLDHFPVLSTVSLRSQE